MPVLKLTQAFIANSLICPDGKKRIEYCDRDVPGLYVELRASKPGQGTYYLRYKNAARKTAHQKIGRTMEVSLAEARKKAKALKAEIALGSDPKEGEGAQQSVMTFSDLFEKHFLPFVKPRKRSWQKDEGLYRKRIKKVFGHKQLEHITRKQIEQFHTDLLAEGLAEATCNHHLKLMRHALNRAVDWEYLEKNPADRIQLFMEDNKVEHYLDRRELERLLKVLETDENRTACNVTLFLLSTGARLNEALRAKWDEIDLSNRLWRISASNSKSKRVRSVPLNDTALDVLSRLESKGEHAFLFVNPRTEKPYSSIQKPWVRIRKKAGLPHLRIHDLRHQYASFLVNSGRTLYEVQQILGHSAPIVTQRYAHLSTKTLQDAANSASDMIRGAAVGA